MGDTVLQGISGEGREMLCTNTYHVGKSQCQDTFIRLTSVVFFWQVRKQAAEQLYVQLMTLEDTAVYGEECLDAAFDILTEVAWDGPMEHVKAARSQLLQVFQLGAPESSKATAELQHSTPVRGKRADENASYQALINDGSRL